MRSNPRTSSQCRGSVTGSSLPSSRNSTRTPPRPARATSRTYVALAFGILLLAGAVTYYLAARRDANSEAAAAVALPKTIAVLPFLDLTDSMNEEPFADGMTEELIHKLSKVPGLRVPAPTASFYFKGKQLPVAEIAKSLRVSYVLDGSVRKSARRCAWRRGWCGPMTAMSSGPKSTTGRSTTSSWSRTTSPVRSRARCGRRSTDTLGLDRELHVVAREQPVTSHAEGRALQAGRRDNRAALAPTRLSNRSGTPRVRRSA